MTAYRLSALQRSNAETILAVVRRRQLPDVAAVYAIAASGAESSLTNWANAGRSRHIARGGRLNGRQLNEEERTITRRSQASPHSQGVPFAGDNLDSVGLFAQRWTEGWGDVMDLMNPEHSTGLFLDALTRVQSWNIRPAGVVIRQVQGYYSDVYSAWLETAQAFVDGHPPAPVSDQPSGGSLNYVQTPDGRRLAYDDTLTFMVEMPDIERARAAGLVASSARPVDDEQEAWVRSQVGRP